MRGMRACHQPGTGTMSLWPVSAPVLIDEEREPVRRWTARPALGWTERGRTPTPARCRASSSDEGCGIGWRARHNPSTAGRLDRSVSAGDRLTASGPIHTAPTPRHQRSASVAVGTGDTGVGVLT
ncbi:MAG: hypothetical protein QOE94_1849 [Mycobacterium sp.]|jgi:hypothetical protein|nr:hypothetical protein [Mycobacterium sp.]